MTQLLANNVSTTLAADLPIGATGISVVDGSKMPTPSGNDYFLVTVFKVVNGVEQNHEVIKVSSRSVNTLTGLVRGYEGAEQSFVAGDRVEMRATKDSFDKKADLDSPVFTGEMTIDGVKTGLKSEIYAASVDIDLSATINHTLTLTGDLSLNTLASSRQAGRMADIRIIAGAADRLVTLNPAWTVIGSVPTKLLANKTAILSIRCYGVNESDVVAVWGAQI